MRKIKRKIKKRYLALMLALLVFCVAYSIIHLTPGYSMLEEESELSQLQLNPMYVANEKTLNPEWVEFNNSTSEEKMKYQIVPSMYIEDEQVQDFSSIYERVEREYGATVTDSYYNLTNHNLTLPNRDQSSSGLCWAFSSLSAVESTMLKKGLHSYSSPVRLSVRQMDYASATANNITEGISPYASSYRVSVYTYGGYSSTPYGLLASGVSPVVEDGSMWSWNNSTSKRSLNDVINVNNVDYFVKDIAKYGGASANASRSGTDEWIQKIKYHVKNYGEVAIGTIGPSTKYGGSCVYTDSNGTILINENGSCNPAETNNGHAMTIIGWDDNYTYTYCKGTNTTSSSTAGCSNVISGKGAFILKNSWGNSTKYPYIAYSSLYDYAYGIVDVERKSWDVNYDATKPRSFHKVSSTAFEVTYKKGIANETLKRITFETNAQNGTYSVYFKNGTGSYELVETLTASYAGVVSVDLSKSVSSTSFSIKVTTNGATISNINGFSSYGYSTGSVITDTVVPSEVVNYVSTFDIYTTTRNVPVGARISYEVYTSSGANITSLFNFNNLYNINGMVDSNVTVLNKINAESITIYTYYNGIKYDTDVISIISENGLWSEGSGSAADPFIIKTAEDFKNIFAESLYLDSYFKFANDIDFSGVSYEPTINKGSFRGVIDGNGYAIYNLTVTSPTASLIYDLYDGTVKNLSINNSSFTNSSGVYAGAIAAVSTYGVIENVVVGPDVTISGSFDFAGGLIGMGREVDFKDVANYSDVTNNSTSNNAYNGGIIGYAEGSYFERVFNMGDVTSKNAVTGGIAGRLELENGSDSNILSYIYNRGDVEGSTFNGGLFGYDIGSSLEYAYSIDNGDAGGTCYGGLSGLANYSTYYNVYVYTNGEYLYRYPNDGSVTSGGLVKMTSTQSKNQSTYTKFDFSNVWKMEDSYPVFRRFDVNFITGITASNLSVNKNKYKNISYLITPSDARFKRLQFTSSKTSIATVDSNGRVKGVAEGNTTIKLKTTDGTNISKSITVNVTNIPLDFGSLNVDEERNLILKVNPKTKVSSIVNEITTTGTIKVISFQNKVLTDSQYIGTGSSVQITISGTTYYYTVIVTGDVTGSGTVGMGSLTKLANHTFVGGIIKESYFILSGDLNGDGKLSFADVMKLANTMM